MSTDMTFEQAMAAARSGRMVRRARWGRKKQDAYLLDAEAIAACDWMTVDAEPVTQDPLVTDEHAPGEGYSQAYADQMRTALLTIAAFQGADSDLDATAACMRRYAQDALMPPASSLRAPEVGESNVVDANNLPPGFKGELTELTLDELTKGPLTDLPTLLDGLPAVPESGNVPLANGCRLYWQTDKSINTRVYSSDEIGGGVEVWNPALVNPQTLLTAIVTEEHIGRLELEHARRRTEGKIMRPSAKTFSIFGQIEAAAAEVMITNGDITKIPTEQIPASVRVNASGQHALFAVIVPADKLGRFEELIEKLYA